MSIPFLSSNRPTNKTIFLFFLLEYSSSESSGILTDNGIILNFSGSILYSLHMLSRCAFVWVTRFLQLRNVFPLLEKAVLNKVSFLFY